MWDRNHQARPISSSPGPAPSSARAEQVRQPYQPGVDESRQRGLRDRPAPPDVLEGFGGDGDGDGWDEVGDAMPNKPYSLSRPPHTWPATQARQILREFLRAVPRAEPAVTLALARSDGSVVVITRAQLAAAIDALRPRQRQVVRLTLEEGWTRQRVCEYLRISLKTLVRDQTEALDALVQL